MDACIIAGFSIIVILAAISLIGAWLSDDSKGLKISCTITIIIAIGAFLCAYVRNPFCFNGDEGMIGTIATIVSIPAAVLIGWNIYTIVDFNKKTEKMEEKAKKEIEEIKIENKKLKNDCQSLKKDLEYMQSDITFTSIFNYAMKIDNEKASVQYAIDGYIDALNVAIKDNLRKDRVEAVINALFNILDESQNIKSPILPNKKEYYNSVVSKIQRKGVRNCSLGELILKYTKEEYTTFPSGYIKVTSEYNPDSSLYNPQHADNYH